MNILHESVCFFNREILSRVPVKHRSLFSFGFAALTLHPFTSLNSNARMVIPNRSTAESKVYRLVHNKSIPDTFVQLTKGLHLVSATDTVNVDFSSFGTFAVLTFAKQTHLGRALPLYVAVLPYPIESVGSQTRFVMFHLDNFVNSLGFSPFFVFDRGFESPYLIPFMTRKNIPFVVRFKADKHVIFEGLDIPLRNIPNGEIDIVTMIYGQNLRLIISDKKSQKQSDKDEPWYLVTNDFTLSAYQIIGKYYFRFEIEEVFKDNKHVQNFNKFFPIKKRLTMKIILYFLMFFIWLSFLIEGMESYIESRIKKRRRERLSLPRFLFEQLELEKFLAVTKLRMNKLSYVAG